MALSGPRTSPAYGRIWVDFGMAAMAEPELSSDDVYSALLSKQIFAVLTIAYTKLLICYGLSVS